MVIKILPGEVPEEKEHIYIPDPPSEELELVEEELHNNLDLRNKKLAELKIMANDAERQIIANKLKTHFPSQVKGVQYGQPRFFKKPSAK